MSNTATNYKKTLSGSVGAGMGAVFSPNGRTYYILEHKVSTRYHKAGEWQEIIVNQIELGRDPSCQVRFDEQFDTVSRHHAAIVRDGDNWKLVQLSKTNTTLLNGHQVKTEWYLQNGDEIQLSVNGPKLGFIIPSGNKSTVGSIGLSRRLSLFRQQALRPYRTALIIVAALLVLALAAGAWFIYQGHNENKDLQLKLEQTEQQLSIIQSQHRQEMDSLSQKYKTLEQDLRDARKVASQPVPRTKVGKNVKSGDGLTAEQQALALTLISNTYYMTTLGYKITSQDGVETELLVGEKYEIGGDSLSVPMASGVGILLDDGVLLTTRQIVEPWFFGNDPIFALLNWMGTSGSTIVATIYCVSASGDEFTIMSDYFTCNHSQDEQKSTDEGFLYTEAKVGLDSYAYARMDLPGGLTCSRSYKPAKGEELLLIGYPNKPASKVDPDAATAVSAVTGLKEGFIVLEKIDEVNLSAGSMVLAQENGEIMVVGLLLGVVPEKRMGLAIPMSAVQF